MVMSFAYLKGGPDKTKPKRKELLPQIDTDKRRLTATATVQDNVSVINNTLNTSVKAPGCPSGIQIGNRQGLTPKDKLMQSRFCYGCSRFTVDAPDTDNEQGFCLRELPDEAMCRHEWKIICPETTIGRCPRVVSREIKLF